MKKTLALFFICISFLYFAQNKTAQDFNFVGKWKGVDKNKTGYFIFEKDGTATIAIGDALVGGKDYYKNGKKATIFYSIDRTAKPINIDFILHLDGIEKTERLVFIAEIIDDNSYKIGSNFNSERPTEFVESNTMVMTRVQE